MNTSFSQIGLKRVVVLFVVGVGIFSGCNGGEPSRRETRSPASQVIAEARGFLMKGDYYHAQDRFAKVLDEYEELMTEAERIEALSGFVVSATIYTLNSFSVEMDKQMTNVSNMLSGSKASSFTSQAVPSPFSVNQLVNNVVKGLILEEAGLIRPYLAKLLAIEAATPDPVVFVIDDPRTTETEYIPIYLGNENSHLWLKITGELDRGDFLLLDSLFSVIEGVGEIILSVNWEVDLNTLINSGLDIIMSIVSTIPIPLIPDVVYIWGTEEEVPLMPAISSLMASVLNKSPAFLLLAYSDTLPLGGGPLLLKDAASKIREGSAGFSKAFSWIRNEPNPGNGPISMVTSAGQESFRLKFYGFDMANWNTSKGSQEQKQADLQKDVGIVEQFFPAIENIANNLKENGGPRITWSKDLSWITAYAMAFMIQTAALPIILELTVGKLDPSMVGDILSYLKLAQDPPNIKGILFDSFFPALNMIELDLGYALYHPQDRFLRASIPYWTKVDGEGNGYLVMEYECNIPTQSVEPSYDPNFEPYPLGATATLCPKEAIVDSGHFQGLDTVNRPAGVSVSEVPRAISADGRKSEIPYLAWLDPSFNGLLYLNGSPADNYWMNYFTIWFYENLISFMSVAGL